MLSQNVKNYLRTVDEAMAAIEADGQRAARRRAGK